MRNTTWTRTSALCIALVLLSGSALLAAGSKKEEPPKTSAHDIYNEGVDLLDQGEYAAAAAKFEAAVEQNGDFAQAHNNLAYCLRKQGKDHFSTALEHYNKAIELDPKLAEAYQYRGVLYALQGEAAKAKADHSTLLDLDSELADGLMKVIASGEEPQGTAGASSKWQ